MKRRLLSLLLFVMSFTSSLITFYFGWEWFIYPITGLENPGVLALVGSMFLLSFLFTNKVSYYHYLVFKNEINPDYTSFYLPISSTVYSLLTLLILFLVHLWM